MKKIGLLFLTFIGILLVGVSFANPIAVAPGWGSTEVHPGSVDLVRETHMQNIEKQFIEFSLLWVITILIETLILFIIAKLFRKEDKISNWKLILFGIIPTTITLPFLRFVLPLIIGKGIWYTIIGELLVVAIETIIIKYGLKISRGKAILASVVCNAASYGVGLLIL